MKKTLIAALLAASSLSAMASDYYVVVPVPARTTRMADISVALSGYSLPNGSVGRTYAGFDFNTLLQVKGDPQFNPSAVSWSVAGGALPVGMVLDAQGRLTGMPTTATTASFQVQASYKTNEGAQAYQVIVTDVTVTLPRAELDMVVGTPAAFNLNDYLVVSGDTAYTGDGTGVTWSQSGGHWVTGMSLPGADGRFSGTPTHASNVRETVTANYAGKTVSAIFTLKATANIVQYDGYRGYADGTYAQSCQAYLASISPYLYSGATGDGVYRISPASGTTMDVYCNQTANGGGWTLLMKQASDDGVTLQGDTTYWSSGATLNDTAAGQNMSDGNFVSAAFSTLPVTQYMLQAGNESTVKTYSRASSTALVAFSNANVAQYADPVGVPQTDPDWFIHTSTYPDGSALTQARFGFNIMGGNPNVTTSLGNISNYCGARWGWYANSDSVASGLGTPDACGGLGGYGAQYGSHIQMQGNKSVWQPATLYLWAK